MEIFYSNVNLSQKLLACKQPNQSIGFVPTMGALHQGHLSLIETALLDNDIVVVSIFVNPTQFNNIHDLKSYPKTLEEDVKKIESLSSSKVLIFAPTVEDIYGSSVKSSKFDFGGLEFQMEGEFRPGHFDGVATVVRRLFEIVQPHIAYFGEKDFQQLQIIKKLVTIMKANIKIVSCPIARESNGLAMSSRNMRLSSSDKDLASKIYFVLKNVKEQFATNDINTINQWVKTQFEMDDTLKLEYFHISEESTLSPTTTIMANTKYRAFLAAYIRDVRLIDNIALN